MAEGFCLWLLSSFLWIVEASCGVILLQFGIFLKFLASLRCALGRLLEFALGCDYFMLLSAVLIHGIFLVSVQGSGLPLSAGEMTQ